MFVEISTRPRKMFKAQCLAEAEAASRRDGPMRGMHAQDTSARLLLVSSQGSKKLVYYTDLLGAALVHRSDEGVCYLSPGLDYHNIALLLPADRAPKMQEIPEQALAEATALRNASLQGACMMIAARALGLDCGPMSGFSHEAVDGEFFAGTAIKSNFICCLGYGKQPPFSRNPRLTFEEAGRLA